HFNIVRDEPKSVVEIKNTPSSRAVAPSPDKQVANPFTATRAIDIDPQLNPRYTFENYCSSDSNKIAVSIAESIANNPQGNPFNPLFVFGPTGVGKTHLIQAVGIRIKEQHPENRVLYVTARLFMSQYSTAVLKSETNKFFNFYQGIHTLIIDDVQDLSGKSKQSTQNTLYHIFNHLYLNNRQIILSSDRAPAEMEGFEERLLGRFKCGMSVSLDKPDKDLRRSVLILKARQDGIELDDEIIEYIAGNVTESIRELEGIMVSLVAHAAVLNRPITLDLAKMVVSNAIKINRRQINFEVIAREVSTYFGLEPDVLFTKSRKREISDARQVTIYLVKKLTPMPLTAIGR
ncbi:MAG: chromosomal replication initiator protein DnaA, partial [Muribaculaceae bacterium]|nr:chromosomal replication initiator protein DnaA [Muribaculaceae bacterium]